MISDSFHATLLVTGARGKLAERALPRLRDHYSLRLTDRLPGDGDPAYAQADLTSFSEVVSLMDGVQTVLHCAVAAESENPPPPPPRDELNIDDQSILRVNLDGTYHLFEAARRAGVKKIVLLSSLTSYLGNKARERYDLSTPLEPLNLYACTKIFGDNLGQFYAREYGISVICLRLGQPYPLLPRLDDIWKNNKRARSWFVTIEDINQAILCALKAEVTFGVYNIVSASDNPRFDLSPALEIGYVPRGYFSDGGLAFYENGNWPPFGGQIVTQAPSR